MQRRLVASTSSRLDERWSGVLVRSNHRVVTIRSRNINPIVVVSLDRRDSNYNVVFVMREE